MTLILTVRIAPPLAGVPPVDEVAVLEVLDVLDVFDVLDVLDVLEVLDVFDVVLVVLVPDEVLNVEGVDAVEEVVADVDEDDTPALAAVEDDDVAGTGYSLVVFPGVPVTPVFR